MKKLELRAALRTALGKKVKELRKKGRVPGVVYGPKAENVSLDFSAKELAEVVASAGSSTLVKLQIDELDSINVLFQEPQVDPISGRMIHIDCYAVKMDEEIETEIPLKFVGASPAVEDLEGNLVVSKEEITVRCLPANLVSEIEVDLSLLKTFDDSIRISDLAVPALVEVLHDRDEVVASVSEPISEEELAELESDTAETEAAAVEELGKETTDPVEQEESKS